MVRAFIGVDISGEARNALEEVIWRLQERGVSGMRWVKVEAVHLTLKFLGDVDTAQVDTILEAMERACRGTVPFSLCLSEELGAFPGRGSPRVLWVGLEGEMDPLKTLQDRIDQQMHLSGGFPRDGRVFTPHLTLGRMRDNVSGEQRRRAGAVIAEVTLPGEVSWKVGEVNLMSSTLTPQGAVYDVLASRALKASPPECS